MSATENLEVKQSYLLKSWALLMLLQTPWTTQFKASDGEDATDLQSILALHAWFAANVFARNTEKYQKTHIAWNVEQFVIALVYMFVWFCVWNTTSVCWKFSCTSAKSFTSWNYAVGRKQILDFRFKIVLLFQNQSNHMPIINGLRSTINRLQPWVSEGKTGGSRPSMYFKNFSKKKVVVSVLSGKNQFHHFCPTLEKILPTLMIAVWEWSIVHIDHKRTKHI